MKRRQSQVLCSGTAQNTSGLTSLSYSNGGGEQRVEVYLHNRRATDSDVEIAVTGLLFHGGSEDTTDLDDVDCEAFVLQVGDKKVVKFTLDVDLDWSGNDTDWCDALDLGLHESGLMGGDFLTRCERLQ